MKKPFIPAVLVICSSLILSCAKEESRNTDKAELVPMSFSASNGEVTKTYLSNGTDVEWVIGDEISILDAYTTSASSEHNQRFTCDEAQAGGLGHFSGNAAENSVYFAAYPYDANDFITSEGKMRAALTSAQTASAAGTFDPKLNTAVAVLKDGVFQFKNLGGLIKFTLSQENVTKVTLTANDHGNIGGVFYLYFDEDGNIDGSRTSVASARTTLTLSPKDRTTFEAGTYYFVVAPRTYEGGISMTFARTDGDPKTVSTSADVIVERSKVTKVGTIDTSVPSGEETDPVSFPVEFPLGFPEGNASNTGFCNVANLWAVPWATDEACASSTRTTQAWSGYHGKMLCKEQNQAYIRWYWDSAISSTGVKYFIETANSGGSNLISTFGVKGIWTDDFFEITLPVKEFVEYTTLRLSMPIYTRNGPTFWEVLYLDGTDWKSTAVDNLPAYPGSDITRRATWAIPFGGAAASSTVNTVKTVDMTFDNAIDDGEIVIRVKCVDGSIISSAENTVTEVTKPANSSNTANAPFYFWNPASRASHSITIDNLGSI